jgi:hypothetical protein
VAHKDIIHNHKNLSLHKAKVDPSFNEKTVLVTDTWDYVDLWLKRNHKPEAQFFWQQARHFYHATYELPKISSPLTAYYCFLNATKALLMAKGIYFTDRHGVSGETIDSKISLSNENVTIKAAGILPELCKYVGETANNDTYTLRQILYNLPYIHRAYDLTYKSSAELFVALNDPKIVKSMTTKEAWFCAELDGKDANNTVIKKLPNAFERDTSDNEKYIIRRKKRFNWNYRDKAKSLADYKKYHLNIRKHLYYIYGPQRLWYLKIPAAPAEMIDRSSLTLTFAAMHKLSELSRYQPDVLARHFNSSHNWLLSEFIATAPIQFIDELSSELTGLEFMIPGRASRG